MGWGFEIPVGPVVRIVLPTSVTRVHAIDNPALFPGTPEPHDNGAPLQK